MRIMETVSRHYLKSGLPTLERKKTKKCNLFNFNTIREHSPDINRVSELETSFKKTVVIASDLFESPESSFRGLKSSEQYLKTPPDLCQ